MAFSETNVIKEHLKKLAEEPDSTLSIEDIKELVNSDLAAKDILNDDEIEGILLVCAAERIQAKKKLSTEEMAKELGFGADYWNALTDGDSFPTPSQLIALRTFVQNS